MFGIDDAVAAITPVIGKVIDRVWPDPADQAKAKLELLQLQQTGELAQLLSETDLAKAQLAVNQVEAASTSRFTSNWRPFIGWTCGAAFAWQFVIGPFSAFWLSALGKQVDIPTLDMSTMMPVLLGMLGLGAMRSYDKKQGTAN